MPETSLDMILSTGVDDTVAIAVMAAVGDAEQPALLQPDDTLTAATSLTAGAALALFEDQYRSRMLDVAARNLKSRGEGFYTISSAGHENNAVVGALTRSTDPAFLHYRSGGFVLARSRQDPSVDAVLDTALSLTASSDDPIAAGRHKVWGSRRLWMPPQTSTIASHVPKAVGCAFAIGRRRRVPFAADVPDDAIVVCSFGDASANHATALAGINAARYSHRRGSRVPVLFVCEDNGIGISVQTPRRWITDTFSGSKHLSYFRAEGDIENVWETVDEAVHACRGGGKPVFLHLPTVRLWGHAGSDVESGYRTAEEIAEDARRDPVAACAKRLIATGAASAEDLAATLVRVRADVDQAVKEAVERPRLSSRAEVMAPLAPYAEEATRADAVHALDEAARRSHFRATLPEEQTAPARRTLAAHINAALHDEMLRRREVLVFGEDVARKGGVYYVTVGLQQRFGTDRVFDTLLDETTILGVAQGAGLLGLLPVPEIQYLAYVHNALDQIRGEAASLSFFSSGQYTNPMVIRIAGLAYQKGFGGHFHNDNSVGALRDIPGLVLAVPSRGDDAAKMLRGCLALAAVNGRPVCFLEPIALYHEKDLYEEGDGGWLCDYPPPGHALLPGEVGTYGPDASPLVMLTYGNGVRMSLRAARRLEETHSVSVKVVDLRWLNPLPFEAIDVSTRGCDRVLVVDEGRATGGGIADAVIAHLVEGGFGGRIASVRSADTYIPLGPAADTVLLQEADVVAGAARLLQ